MIVTAWQTKPGFADGENVTTVATGTTLWVIEEDVEPVKLALALSTVAERSETPFPLFVKLAMSAAPGGAPSDQLTGSPSSS